MRVPTADDSRGLSPRAQGDNPRSVSEGDLIEEFPGVGTTMIPPESLPLPILCKQDSR